MGTEHRRQGGRRSLERNMGGGNAGPLLKQQVREMAEWRRPGRGHVDVGAPTPGVVKELTEIRNAEAAPHDEKLSCGGDEGNRLEAFQRIGVDVRIKVRIDGDRIRHHQERVSVRRRGCHECGACGSTGAGPLLDHNRRRPRGFELVRENARTASIGPPGAAGTTSLTVRDGKSCASSAAAATTTKGSAKAATICASLVT